MTTRLIRVLAIVSYTPILLFSGSANAHHGMDGQLPSTILEGLISGLAHPILGLDHLLFVISIGLLAAMSCKNLSQPLTAFVIASICGVLLHVQGIALPSAELVIAVSIVVAGLSVISRTESPVFVVAFSASAGLFHGFAYGEAIYGAPVSAITAYLSGISLVQFGIAIITFRLARKLLTSSVIGLKQLSRLSGTGIALFGAFLMTGLG